MKRCLLVFCAVGCGGEAARQGAAAVVRDSAGIRIVENSGPAWAEGAGWRVADSPLVSIGGVAGDPAYDLTQITSVILREHGQVAAAVARQIFAALSVKRIFKVA